MALYERLLNPPNWQQIKKWKNNNISKYIFATIVIGGIIRNETLFDFLDKWFFQSIIFQTNILVMQYLASIIYLFFYVTAHIFMPRIIRISNSKNDYVSRALSSFTLNNVEDFVIDIEPSNFFGRTVFRRGFLVQTDDLIGAVRDNIIEQARHSSGLTLSDCETQENLKYLLQRKFEYANYTFPRIRALICFLLGASTTIVIVSLLESIIYTVIKIFYE